MITNEQTSKAYFNSLKIIHTAILTSQVILGIIFYYLNAASQENSSAESLDKIFQIVIPILVAGGIIGSAVILRLKLKTIKVRTELKNKLGEYRNALIVGYAIMEGPSLFSLVCYYITGNILYLACAGLITLVFLINKPSKYIAANDLDLNTNERALIEDPDAIIT